MGNEYYAECSITDGCDWSTRGNIRERVKEDYKEHILQDHFNTLLNEMNQRENEWDCDCGYTIEGELPESGICPECGRDWVVKHRAGMIAGFSIQEMESQED